jgi:hypothetical protein
MSAGMIRKAIATFKSGLHPQKPGNFGKTGFLNSRQKTGNCNSPLVNLKTHLPSY